MSEVALAVILVVAAGLLVRSLLLLEKVDPGFEAAHAVSFQVQLPPVRYPDDAKMLAAVDAIERRLREQPGFESIGVASTLP